MWGYILQTNTYTQKREKKKKKVQTNKQTNKKQTKQKACYRSSERRLYIQFEITIFNMYNNVSHGCVNRINRD